MKNNLLLVPNRLSALRLIMRYTAIAVVFITLILALIKICSASGYIKADARISLKQSESTTLSVQLSQNTHGNDAVMGVNLISASNVQVFNLVIEYEPNRLCSSSATEFDRNINNFPEVTLGDYVLNTAQDAGPGKIRIIGLAPTTNTTSMLVGSLRLHISPDAPIGAEQTITVSGEVNLSGSGVVTIPPVIAILKVVDLKQFIYLPFVRREQ